MKLNTLINQLPDLISKVKALDEVTFETNLNYHMETIKNLFDLLESFYKLDKELFNSIFKIIELASGNIPDEYEETLNNEYNKTLIRNLLRHYSSLIKFNPKISYSFMENIDYKMVLMQFDENITSLPLCFYNENLINALDTLVGHSEIDEYIFADYADGFYQDAPSQIPKFIEIRNELCKINDVNVFRRVIRDYESLLYYCKPEFIKTLVKELGGLSDYDYIMLLKIYKELHPEQLEVLKFDLDLLKGEM